MVEAGLLALWRSVSKRVSLAIGGDTVTPSTLYARLCHAFLVSFFFNDRLENNYLRIYHIDFHKLFIV